MVLRRFMQIEATFRPGRTDNLKPGMAEVVGRRGVFEVAWLITEDDGGEYVGRWACTSGLVEPYLWVPDCDLADVTVLGMARGGGAPRATRPTSCIP